MGSMETEYMLSLQTALLGKVSIKGDQLRMVFMEAAFFERALWNILTCIFSFQAHSWAR
jgi:hypothetical protein